MNDENLEQHLRNLPAPELPEAWRGPILSKALREARVSSKSRENWPALFLYLRHLFRQNPITTGALATLWMLILLLRAGTPVDSSSRLPLARMDPNRPIHLVSLSEQIRLAEFLQDEPEQKQIP